MDDLRITIPLAAMMLAPLAIPAVAQQFRVETEVFNQGAEEPVSESLTIFDGDVVYDFVLGALPETAVFDIRRGRIVCLDPQRKIQTALTTENLLEFCDATRTRAGNGQDKLFHPQFETSFDDQSQTLTLNSDAISYTARCAAAKDAESAKRFQQFADWYARLNFVRPGSMPPFARVELNRLIAERNLLPLQVERTVVLKNPVGNKRGIARSVHAVTWLISNSDRHRIETVATQLTSFRNVPFKEYSQADATAKAD